MSTNSFSATAWRNGTGANTILGTESASDIDSVSYNNYTYPIDSMMRNYHRGVRIAYASASTLTVSIGEIMLSNAAGTIRLMQANTSAITAAWTMIDTGAEAASTTYYLWAYQETVDDDDFDVSISTSSTAPSGKTYFARIGSFYNDSSSNIIRITNDEPHQTATYDSGWFAVAVNSTYSKTHGLGTTKVLSTLWFSNSSTGASNVFEVYQTHPNNVGGQVYDLDTTSLDIYTDATHVAQKVIAAGSVTSYTSGYYRVILIGLE